MRERAQDRFRAMCSAGDGGEAAEGGGGGGRGGVLGGRAELGNMVLRRVDRSGGRRVGGWRWVVRR